MTRSRVLSSRFRERVIVTLKSGDCFDGILYSADRVSLVLRNAEAVGVGEKRTNLPVDGEVIVLLADVLYIQRP
jgi:small nuclear ribonucleoprotein (snRNP)-like protein